MMSAPSSTAERPAPGSVAFYQPRPCRFIRHERLGDWRVKVYGIATPGRMPRPALVDATVALAASALPADADAAGRMGAALAIAHDAATASIAMVYWWEAFNELRVRAFAGPLAEPHAMQALTDPAAGCVWELGIVDFERRAWIADVLANPKGPDLERYFSRELSADI